VYDEDVFIILIVERLTALNRVARASKANN